MWSGVGRGGDLTLLVWSRARRSSDPCGQGSRVLHPTPRMSESFYRCSLGSRFTSNPLVWARANRSSDPSRGSARGVSDLFGRGSGESWSDLAGRMSGKSAPDLLSRSTPSSSASSTVPPRARLVLQLLHVDALRLRLFPRVAAAHRARTSSPPFTGPPCPVREIPAMPSSLLPLKPQLPLL